MFHIFSADTITGKRQVAVKVSKDHIDGETRTDAYTVAFSIWGRGAKIASNYRAVRRLTNDFVEAKCAGGWGWIA